MRSKLCFLLVVLFSFPAISQEEEDRYFGDLSGEARSFFLHTANKGELKDYSALALGGFLKYQYKTGSKWEFGAAFYSSFNTNLEDLQVPDERTGKTSRYEEGLFDRLNLNDRLVTIPGELYIKYQTDRHSLVLGRMKFCSPLVNGQDGRMIPSLFQGLKYSYKTPRTIFQAAVFNAVAPRSTGQFYKIVESIGTYPVGRSQSANAALYANNTNSDYLLIANFEQRITDNTGFELWNYFTQNVSNSVYLKPYWKLDKKITLSAEWLHQNQIGDGGNKVDSLRYFSDNSSDILGLQVKYQFDNSSSISLGYDRILPHGQFLFPREWGREFLFSFQKRERSEGSADNHALVATWENDWQIFRENIGLQSILSVGHQWKPSVLDPEKNKYAIPDYTHINLDLFFHFEKLKNLQPELLLVTKLASGDFPENPNFYYNKTDLFQVNFVLNYLF